MRFIDGGPIFPDELLNARDEGQVIFFCGAGVSRAKARLPDFLTLARRVVDALGTLADSPARSLLEATEVQGRIPGVGALLPADRIFGLLEREFPVSAVRSAVAQALKPKRNVDLSAHRTLLDLARGPDDIVRLVTTNFDRLFEACDRGLRFNGPASLPDPRRVKHFSGIVHLHGHVTKSYDGAHDDEFVLSTADFGRAYLSDGWATTFIRGLLEKYQLVFIGYTADDPPVHYLLEALNAGLGPQGNMFAFQEGPADEARALWSHKGVRAIPFDPANGYAALWSSLERWAERARDPTSWRSGVLDDAMAGPRASSPVHRGQVRHLVSTVSGASAFAARSPPSDWLNVFDAHARYGQPRDSVDDEPVFDPFDAFGLDDDQAPPPPDPNDMFAKRAKPQGAWDAFELNEGERFRVEADHLTPLRGFGAARQPRLLPRQSALGAWIVEVAEQPEAIWWAAGQGGLHPELQQSIEYRMDRRPLEPIAEKAWGRIFQAWQEAKHDADMVQLRLQSRIRRLGWTAETVRAAAQLQRARVEVTRPWRRPVELDKESIQLDHLLSTTLEFSRIRELGKIPDEFLPLYVAELRHNLEISVELHNDVYGTHGLMLPALIEDADDDADERTYGIAQPFVGYADNLRALAALDPRACLREVRGWTSSSALFDRLRVLAVSEKSLLPPNEAAKALLSLDARSFWSAEGQRDLLLTLSARWSEFPLKLKRGLEGRILRGPPKRAGEETKKYRRRRAASTMSWLQWLSEHGVAFSFDVSARLAAMQPKAPEWRKEWASGAARSLSSKSGWVETDASTRGLEDTPVGDLLDRVEEASGHDWNSLVERKPLQGLVVSRPAKVLRSLVLDARDGRYRQGAWQSFLWSDRRKDDRTRLLVQIGRRLAALPEKALAALADDVAHWMLETSPRLHEKSQTTFDALWNKMVGVLREHPETTNDPKPRSRGIDWGSHSLNSPAGRLGQAAFAIDAAADGDAPNPELLERLEGLLALPGSAGRDALVIAASRVAWLHYQAPAWTNARLLGFLSSVDEEDVRAFWSGFFWANRLPNTALYQRLKHDFFKLVGDWDEGITGSTNLPGFILAGWRTTMVSDVPTVITDDEMRALLIDGGERFRTGVISQIDSWFGDHGWDDAAIRLFKHVWPKQRIARSAAVSDRLVDFALDSGDRFAEVVDAVVPFVTPLRRDSWTLYKVKDYQTTEAPRREPEALIRLLHAALGPNAGDWPYRADSAVEDLATDPSLASNSLLTELRIRLAAR